MINGPSGQRYIFASSCLCAKFLLTRRAQIPGAVVPCSVKGKTVGAEALELLPVSGCLWIKARWSTNADSGAAFKNPNT